MGRHAVGEWLRRSRPCVRLFRGFLTHAECDRLRNLALPHLEPTRIDAGDMSSVRRSALGAWLPRSDANAGLWRRLDISSADAALVGQVEHRIARASGVPLINGEPSQVLRYSVGDRYSLHPDFLDPSDEIGLANGGQRKATFLIYLCTLPLNAGGRTIFPKCEPPLHVQPRAGDAIMWRNVHLDGRHVDVHSMHASEPVRQVGACPMEKWVFSKWLRKRRFAVDIAAFDRTAAQRRADKSTKRARQLNAQRRHYSTAQSVLCAPAATVYSCGLCAVIPGRGFGLREARLEW